MSIKCIVKNKVELDRLLTIFPNPSLIDSVYTFLEGNTSHIRTQEDFKKEYLNSKAASEKNTKIVAKQGSGIEGIPLSKFSYEQQLEMVDNITFLAAWDTEADSVKDIKDIEFFTISDKLKASMDKAGNEAYKDNYEELIKPENLEVLVAMAKAKLARANIIIDEEADPDSKNDGLGIKPSNQVESKDKARVNAKLIVSFLTDQTNSYTLGLNTFSNFNKTWKDLEVSLSNLPRVNKDRMDDFLEAMEKEVLFKPHYRQLIDILKNGSEQLRTQFYISMDNYMINFYNENIALPGKDNGQSGYTTKRNFSENNTNSKRLREVWSTNYVENLTDIKDNTVVPNREAAKELGLKYKDLSGKIATLKNKDVLDAKMLLEMIDVLDAVGIKTSLTSLNTYLKTEDANQIVALKKLSTSLGLIFKSTKSSKGNTVEDFAKGNISIVNKQIVTPLTTESSLDNLSDVQEKYTLSLVNKGILGPDGKMYYAVTQYDYVSRQAIEMQNGTEFFDELEDTYTTNSQYKDYYLDEEYGADRRKKLKLITYLSRKYQGNDQGVSMNDMKEVDEYASRIDMIVTKGMMPYFTMADKSRVYMLDGMPTNKIVDGKIDADVLKIFAGYVVDELNSMAKAHEAIYGDKKVDPKHLTLNYHYKYDTDENGKRFKNFKKGNVFTLASFPSLSPGTELATKLGLYNESEGNKPFPIHDTFLSDIGDETNVETGTIDKILPVIKDTLEKAIHTEYKRMMDTFVSTDENGSVDHISLSKDLYNEYLKDSDLDTGMNNIAANYVVNGMIANTEYTKLFTGDIRFYKTTVDFLKRVPATTATGDSLRKVEGVNETFTVAVAPNFEYQSDYLSNATHIDNIKKLAEDISNPDEKKAMLASIESSAKMYSEVNRTDAQGWITMPRFKELMIGLGYWEESMSPAYDRIMSPGKATAADYMIFAEKMTTMQPKKGMHYELFKDPNTGILKPFYLKYSQAVLFPDFVASNSTLKKVEAAMRAQNISELITGDGVKVGAIEETDIEADEINFNTVTLRNDNWKLQQDLPSKDKDTLVGSQIQVNITADLKVDENYGTEEAPVTGRELRSSIINVVNTLSDRGLDKLSNEIGISSDGTITDTDKLYDKLYNMFKADGESKYLLDALNDRVPFDRLPNKDQVYSKINGMFKSASAKVKQPGGSAIQMSDFGFTPGKSFKTMSDLNSNQVAGITWLKNDTELKPPRYVENTNGDLQVEPGEILLPYNQLAKAFGSEWETIKKLSPSEIMKKIDPAVLNVIGYRIPNQKLASNDSLKVVGILPPNAGSTIIAYAEITAKTGSDFDIDKMYYIQPPITNNKGKVETIKYIDGYSDEDVKARYSIFKTKVLRSKKAKELFKEFGTDIFDASVLNDLIGNAGLEENKLMAELGTSDIDLIFGLLQEEGDIIPFNEFVELSIEEQNTTEALQSRRVDLYKQVLESKHSFISLISSVDSEWLPAQIKHMLPAKKLSDLEVYNPTFQMDTRRENIVSKGGVGQIANQQTDNAISQFGEKRIREDLNRLSYNGTLDLSNPFINEFEILEYDKDGNVTGNIKEILTNAVLLTEVISAYMNAFVDAAKDNYIGRANFNYATNNAAFLMMRSGISPQKVTALMSQPGIKRFIEVTNQAEGQAVKINTKKPLEIVMEEFDVDKDSIDTESNIYNYSTEKLMRNAKSPENADAKEQMDLLNLFIYARDLSKTVRRSVQASKAPVNGPGTTLIESYVMMDKKSNIQNTFNTNGESVIEDFNKMFYNEGQPSMLGTYHKNGPEAVVKAIGPLSMLGSNGMLDSVRYSYKKLYGTELEDVKKTSQIYNMQFAALMSESEAYKLDGKQLRSLMYGDSSIARRMYNLKNTDTYKNNTLVQALVFSPGIEGDPDFVSLNKLGGVELIDNETLTTYWLELFYNKETRKIAEDLVKYSFYTSGLTSGSNTIHELIDFRILNEMGSTNSEYAAIKSKDKNKNELLDYTLRNNWHDTKIVPNVSKKGAVSLNKSNKKDKLKYFSVNANSSPVLVVGYDRDDNTIYKPYVSRTVVETTLDEYNTPIKKRVTYLYKYQGNDTNSSGIYKRVNKLGIKTIKGKLFEFPSSESSFKSIVADNNNALSKENEELFSNFANPVFPGEVFTNVVKVESSDNLTSVEQSVFEKEDIAGLDINEETWNSLDKDVQDNIIKCKGNK